MGKVERVKHLKELFLLIDLYSYKRDLPVDEETDNFFEKVEHYCDLLDLDFETLKKEFQLHEHDDIF